MEIVLEEASEHSRIRAKTPDNDHTHVRKSLLNPRIIPSYRSTVRGSTDKNPIATDNVQHAPVQDPTFNKVKELNKELNNQVEVMNKKIDVIINSHEKNFIDAYRGFMSKTQYELKELKKKFEDQDLKLNQNERYSELQTKMMFFRDESLKLTDDNIKLKKEIDSLKSKIALLTDEKDFLARYIKTTATKSSKLQQQIEESLDAIHLKKPNRSFAFGKSTPNESFTVSRNLSKTATPKRGLRATGSQSNDEIFQLSKVDIENLTPTEKFEKLVNEMRQIHDPQAIVDKFEQVGYGIINELEKKLGQLKKTLEREIKQKNELLRKQAENPTGELEAIFIDCVEQVRKEIFKRKVLSQQTFNNTKSVDGSVVIGNSQTLAQGVVKKNIDYDKFLTNDKQKLIEMFLTNQDVLYYVYEGIFSRNKKKPFSNDTPHVNTSNHPEGDSVNIESSKILSMLEEEGTTEGGAIFHVKDFVVNAPRAGTSWSQDRRGKRDSSLSAKVPGKLAGGESNKTSLEIDESGYQFTGPDLRFKKLIEIGRGDSSSGTSNKGKRRVFSASRPGSAMPNQKRVHY